MTDPVLRTVVRRETHSPRTVAMLVVVVLSVLLLAYAATEIVLWLSGRAPLLISPVAAFDALASLPTDAATGAVIAVAAVVTLVGLLLLVLSVSPGRLSRHEMTWEDRAVVVDNGVVASALAQQISTEAGIARDHVVVGVAHRSVDVTVRPPLGMPVETERVREIVDAELATYRLTPAVRTRVKIVRPADTAEENVR